MGYVYGDLLAAMKEIREAFGGQDKKYEMV